MLHIHKTVIGFQLTTCACNSAVKLPLLSLFPPSLRSCVEILIGHIFKVLRVRQFIIFFCFWEDGKRLGQHVTARSADPLCAPPAF